MKKIIIIILLLPLMARAQYLPKSGYTTNQVSDNARIVNTIFGIPVYSTSALPAGYASISGNGLHLNSTTKALGIYDGTLMRIFPDKAANDAAYVPIARTITINGTSFDLSANRTFTVPVADSNQYRTILNSYSLSGLQTKFNGYVTRNTNESISGSKTFTNSQQFDGAVNIKPANGSSVPAGYGSIYISSNASQQFQFLAPGSGGTFLDLSNTADLTRIARLSDLTVYAPLNSPAFTGIPTAPTATAGTSTTQIATTAFVAATGRTPVVVSANATMTLNADYLNTTAAQYTLTLPPTTGFATDGSKIITVLATGTGGVKISVPSGYSMTSPGGAATTTGTGGTTITQNQKIQLIPVGTNAYQLQPLNGTVTVF